MALHQGVLSSSNLRLRGYRVTNGLNFFFNFLSNVRLRGYRVTNRLNFLSLNFQNEKVTRLPGLQGLQWATRLNLIFLNLLIPGYEVTGFRRLHGYGIAKSSIYLAISNNKTHFFSLMPTYRAGPPHIWRLVKMWVRWMSMLAVVMMIMVRRLVLMSIDDNTDDNKTHFFLLMPTYRAGPTHIGQESRCDGGGWKYRRWWWW